MGIFYVPGRLHRIDRDGGKQLAEINMMRAATEKPGQGGKHRAAGKSRKKLGEMGDGVEKERPERKTKQSLWGACWMSFSGPHGVKRTESTNVLRSRSHASESDRSGEYLVGRKGGY